MTNSKLYLSLYIITLLLILNSICITATEVPKIVPYVNDFAHLLSQDQIDALNIHADAIENNTSFEVAIVTVDSTNGEDRTIFANKIGDLNGVGKKGKSNGIVILWSVDNLPGGATAVGRGAESIFNDAKVGSIGRASRVYFDKGDVYGGFEYYLTQIDNEIEAHAKDTQVLGNGTGLLGNNSSDDGTIIIILVVGFIFFVIINVFIKIWWINDDGDYEEKSYTKRKGKDGKYRYYSGTGRSYATAAAAGAAAALLGSGSESSSDSDDDNSSGGSSSGSSFSGGSFGGGGSSW